MRVGEMKNPAIIWRAPGRLVRISKEADRRLRADQDQLLRSFHEIDDLLGEIGNALDLDAAGAALAARGKCVADDACAGRRSDATCGRESTLLQRGSADQHHGFPARSERSRG